MAAHGNAHPRIPGFEVHPLYDDFSTPTFDTKHNLIKEVPGSQRAMRFSEPQLRVGATSINTPDFAITSEAAVEIPDDTYEIDPEVIPYCELHTVTTISD